MLVVVFISSMFMLNNRDTLRCRVYALDAIRDYNIDQYFILGREKWKRIKYESVMQPYSYTWFSLKKDAKSVIRPEYLDELEIYFKNAKRFRSFK